MGLMDRVRAQATQIAQQAQEAAQEGKARLDQAQAGRRGDMLLRQLGALVFAERTGRGTADSQARIDQLISEISAHESQNGLNLTDPSQPGFGQSLFGQSVWGQSVFGQGSSGQPPADQPSAGQAAPGQPAPGQAAPGQSAPGQSAPGQPPAGHPAPGQSGFGQADSEQQPPAPQPGFPAGPQAAPGQSAPPPGGAGSMPSVDTTTNFFPAPDDEDTGTPPQG
jgi:hypothetical protein